MVSITAGQGFEPRYHAPEACVLPLDDPANIGTVAEYHFDCNFKMLATNCVSLVGLL